MRPSNLTLRIGFNLDTIYSEASEIKRQRALIESGGVVVQETRGFDESIMDTRSLRSKEGAKDYRYMPDGNLSVVVVDPVSLCLSHS